MKGIITHIEEESEDIKSFFLKLDSSFTFVPGQYVMLSFPDANHMRRAFSVVSYDDKNNIIHLIIKKNQEFTSKLFDDGTNGLELNVLGPYGRFTLPNNSLNNLVFIAGGVGITPLYSMMLSLNNDSFKGNAKLFYSGKTRDDMALIDKIDDFQNDNIVRNYFFTKQGDSRINAEMIHDRVENFYDSKYFICGPKTMIESLREDFDRLGVPETNILSEEF